VLANKMLVICPTVIAYCMGQIVKLVCLCPCVRLRALSRWQFLMDFHQNWHRCIKRKFVEGKHLITPSRILLRTSIFRRRCPQKYMQILIATLTALNIRESQKFPRPTGNRGRETRWWRQILDRKWKYNRFANVRACAVKICYICLLYNYYRNSSVVVDLL